MLRACTSRPSTGDASPLGVLQVCNPEQRRPSGGCSSFKLLLQRDGSRFPHPGSRPVTCERSQSVFLYGKVWAVSLRVGCSPGSWFLIPLQGVVHPLPNPSREREGTAGSDLLRPVSRASWRGIVHAEGVVLREELS